MFSNGARLSNSGLFGEKGCFVKMEMRSFVMFLESKGKPHRFLVKMENGLLAFIDLERFWKGFMVSFDKAMSVQGFSIFNG